MIMRYAHASGEIWNGDCLELMKTIPDGSVDMVVTSPPYNMNLRILNNKYTSRQIVKHEFATKYENYKDNLSPENYFNFQKEFLEQCLRVSKLTVYNIQIITGNKLALFKLIGHFAENIKEVMIWDKVNSQPAMKNKTFNSQFEIILFIASDKNNAMKRQFETGNFERGTLSNVLTMKREKSAIKNHGAVFPIKMVESLINWFSDPGDLILDPFSGSATTAIAAHRTGRRSICIERDLGYYLASCGRVWEEQHS